MYYADALIFGKAFVPVLRQYRRDWYRQILPGVWQWSFIRQQPALSPDEATGPAALGKAIGKVVL